MFSGCWLLDVEFRYRRWRSVTNFHTMLHTSVALRPKPSRTSPSLTIFTWPAAGHQRLLIINSQQMIDGRGILGPGQRSLSGSAPVGSVEHAHSLL